MNIEFKIEVGAVQWVVRAWGGLVTTARIYSRLFPREESQSAD